MFPLGIVSLLSLCYRSVIRSLDIRQLLDNTRGASPDNLLFYRDPPTPGRSNLFQSHWANQWLTIFSESKECLWRRRAHTAVNVAVRTSVAPPITAFWIRSCT